MIYKIVVYFYLASLLFASLCGTFKFHRLDRASKVLFILICCGFVNEVAAYFLARKYHNNLSLYTVYSFIEFGLLCLYFNYVIDVFKKKNIGIYLGVAGIGLGIANTVFVQHMDNLNSYFLLLESLLVIGMSLFAFFRMLLKHDSLNLYKYPHFWFISIILFFWNITFLTWGLYSYINTQLRQSAMDINIGLASVGIATYCCFACVFLLYPKMRSVNE